MSAVLESLRFAAQSLKFISQHQLEHRARLVEADFSAIGLKDQLSCQKIPVPGWQGHFALRELPIARQPVRH